MKNDVMQKQLSDEAKKWGEVFDLDAFEQRMRLIVGGPHRSVNSVSAASPDRASQERAS